MKEMERQEQIKEKTYRFNRAGGYKLEGDNEVFIEEEERNLDDYIESKNPCKFKFNEEDAKIILNRISKYFLKIDKRKKLNLSKNNSKISVEYEIEKEVKELGVEVEISI